MPKQWKQSTKFYLNMTQHARFFNPDQKKKKINFRLCNKWTGFFVKFKIILNINSPGDSYHSYTFKNKDFSI